MTIRLTSLEEMAAEGSGIARVFGRAAAYYDRHAEVQRHAASRLMELLDEVEGTLPEGPALEVGCGTGFISRELARMLPHRELELTDLSEEMVSFCRTRLDTEPREGVSIYRADAERWPGDSERYALITAGFVAQWFADPASGLRRLAAALRPGGVLLASIPGAGSFPEWRRACRVQGVPCTARALPNPLRLVEELSTERLEVHCAEEDFIERHDSPLGFFRHLKRMGAAAGSGCPPLSPAEMRRLHGAWERGPGGRTPVTYQILLLTVRKSS